MAINFQRLADAKVNATPYPHLVLGDAIDPRFANSVARDFPLIEAAGAIRVDNTTPGRAFTDLLDDLRSDRFRSIIGRKFDLDLDGKEIVINVRGLSRWTDGNIHTDTPSKLVTVLLYFNQPDTMTATTGLRILKNDYNIEDYAVEVPPVLGNLVAFKVTPDCWHGFKPYEGARHSLQLNYLSGVKSARKHEAGRRMVRHAARRAHGVQIAAARSSARRSGMSVPCGSQPGTRERHGSPKPSRDFAHYSQSLRSTCHPTSCQLSAISTILRFSRSDH